MDTHFCFWEDFSCLNSIALSFLHRKAKSPTLWSVSTYDSVSVSEQFLVPYSMHAYACIISCRQKSCRLLCVDTLYLTDNLVVVCNLHHCTFFNVEVQLQFVRSIQDLIDVFFVKKWLSFFFSLTILFFGYYKFIIGFFFKLFFVCLYKQRSWYNQLIVTFVYTLFLFRIIPRQYKSMSNLLWCLIIRVDYKRIIVI